MKIIAINGSPRKNKNTATLLKKAVEGVQSEDSEVELINLYDLNYKGCISCFYCKRKDKKKGTCIIKDDLSPVLEKIKEADGLILASPIYYFNMTSGMMAFLERLLFSNYLYKFDNASVFPKKIPTAVIYTMNATKEVTDKYGLNDKLSFYHNNIESILGDKPKVLYSYNTYQFDNYDKYEASMFSEEKKAKQRAEQFPVDCTNAFNMGVEIVKDIKEKK